MSRRLIVSLMLVVVVSAGSMLQVVADPWKDESGHGKRRHDRKWEKAHKHKYTHHKHKHTHHTHKDEHATEGHGSVTPTPPPSDPHIGIRVETGDVSIGGRIRIKD